MIILYLLSDVNILEYNALNILRAVDKTRFPYVPEDTISIYKLISYAQKSPNTLIIELNIPGECDIITTLNNKASTDEFLSLMEAIPKKYKKNGKGIQKINKNPSMANKVKPKYRYHKV